MQARMNASVLCWLLFWMSLAPGMALLSVQSPPLRQQQPEQCKRRGPFATTNTGRTRLAMNFHANQSPGGGDNNTPIEYDDFLPNPNPILNATDVVLACMHTLVHRKDGAGLEVCFHFSSDNCRAALGGSLEKFSQYASNPVFGYLVHCVDYEIRSVGPLIAGTRNRGAMQTVLLDAMQAPVTSSTTTRSGAGTSRRFLWTLQKERRPPRQDCWIIHEVLFVKNAFMLTV